jgi:hypothetical protein
MQRELVLGGGGEMGGGSRVRPLPPSSVLNIRGPARVDSASNRGPRLVTDVWKSTAIAMFFF